MFRLIDARLFLPCPKHLCTDSSSHANIILDEMYKFAAVMAAIPEPCPLVLSIFHHCSSTWGASKNATRISLHSMGLTSLMSPSVSTFLSSMSSCSPLYSPLISSDELVRAEELWKHVETHEFGPIHCFHGMPVRMFVPQSGHFVGQPVAACGHPSVNETCNYWGRYLSFLITYLFIFPSQW